MDRGRNRRGEDLTGEPVGRFAASRRTDFLAIIVAIGIGAWLIGLGGRFSFFYDEWAFIFDRGFDLRSLLDPHNGHLSTVPVAAYVTLLRLVGMESYLLFRLMGVATHLAVCIGAYLVVSRRRGWPLGIVALVCLGVLGSGWQNVLWPFQMSMMAPVALAMFGVWMLERNPNAYVSIGSIVGTSLLFSGGGVSVLVAFAVQSIVARAWSRLGVLGGVGLLFGIWLVFFGESQGKSENIPRITGFVRDSVEYSAAGIGGRGGWFAIGLLMALLVGLATSRRWALVSPSTVVPIVAFVTGAILTGYSRADVVGPDASRYVYVGAAYLVVVVLVVVPWSPRLPALVALLPVTAWIVHPNIDIMRREAAVFRFYDDSVRAELAVIEAYGRVGNDEYRPIIDYAPQVYVGEYLDAVEKYGSPAMDVSELVERDEVSKSRLDRIAFEYAGVGTTHAPVEVDASCKWTRVPRSTETELTSPSVLVRHSRTITLAMRMFSEKAPETTRITLIGEGVALLDAPTAPALPRWRFAVNHSVEIGICPGQGDEG